MWKTLTVLIIRWPSLQQNSITLPTGSPFANSLFLEGLLCAVLQTKEIIRLSWFGGPNKDKSVAKFLCGIIEENIIKYYIHSDQKTVLFLTTGPGGGSLVDPSWAFSKAWKQPQPSAAPLPKIYTKSKRNWSLYTKDWSWQRRHLSFSQTNQSLCPRCHCGLM